MPGQADDALCVLGAPCQLWQIFAPKQPREQVTLAEIRVRRADEYGEGCSDVQQGDHEHLTRIGKPKSSTKKSAGMAVFIGNCPGCYDSATRWVAQKPRPAFAGLGFPSAPPSFLSDEL